MIYRISLAMIRVKDTFSNGRKTIRDWYFFIIPYTCNTKISVLANMVHCRILHLIMAKIHNWIHCIFNLTARTWPRFQVPWSGSVTAVCATGPRSCPTSPPYWARTATVRSTKTTSTASCGHAPKPAPDVHRNDPEITVSTVKVVVL